MGIRDDEVGIRDDEVGIRDYEVGTHRGDEVNCFTGVGNYHYIAVL